MKTARFLLCWAALLSGSPVHGAAADRPPPNVVLIVVDDLGAHDLACDGSMYHETPHIDRLAADGMRFTQAYAAAAVCSPSRAAIQTGRTPARLGITDWIRRDFELKRHPRVLAGFEADPVRRLAVPENGAQLEHDEVTLAEALKRRGYATGHIGKWHLGTERWYPESHGYDVNVGGCELAQPPAFRDPYADAKLPGIPGLPARRPGEYLTDREADEAVAFIEARREQPFFLHLSHYAVHVPIQADPATVEKYRAKPPGTQRDSAYASMVESVDRALGRIVTTLRQLELAQRTLVIFTSDNGGLRRVTNNAPLRAGKGYPYEGGLRVPLIAWWPGAIQPGVAEAPVSGIDLFPTICELAGVALPAGRAIDGLSLVPVLLRGEPLTRPALFWHFPHYRWGAPDFWIEPYSVVRAGRWKLIRHYDREIEELFDLSRDPGESADVSLERPDIGRELSARLDRWLVQTGARLPVPNPIYKPAGGAHTHPR